MIVAGQLLLEDETTPGLARLAPGLVRVEDGVISELVEGEIPQAFDLGGPGCLVSPGFVDTHLHLPQFDMIGAHGLPLLEWLSGVTFPSEAKWADADYAAAMTGRVAEQLLSVGTTSLCAYSSVHHAATAAAIETLTKAGLRGVVGQAMSDRFAPDGLVGATAELLDQTADLLHRFPAGGRVAAAVTPRFAVSCTAELLAGAGRLAAEHPRALVQTHLSETVPECELIGELYNGASYVDVYDAAGLVTDRTLLGHGIHLSPAERATLQQAGAVIAHCPTANSFLRSGAMDRHTTITAGVRTSLGTDIGAGYERSMVRVGRAMIETAAALGADYPAAAHAWWQITAGNADAAGFTDAGRLSVGAPADLVVIEPNQPWLTSPVDPLAMLMFAWDDRWVRQTLVRGEIAYRAA
ncbi:Guanine deaminase [Botrimarina colliarenosi]|uniref:Guanine deaminase n=1 Tax=Botrimarina colliarenosi TaxID=2528001 RepID=A0A5C6AEV8_9BACT|nr:amidohydrolase family protein [Botrimarina colliarenosi]TWT98149.1 Guanine deaminase [Botrimarina colliarenosi]